MLKYATVIFLVAYVHAGVYPGIYGGYGGYGGYGAPLGHATSYQYLIKYDQPILHRPWTGYAPGIPYAVGAPSLTFGTGLGYGGPSYGYGGWPISKISAL
ncbi:glycine-rich protein-like [Photinus pyralis]|uniref:glycine-rich protein-like n=1 Tax=Photinus pyralis TaxID=7054 RepID=UPI001267723F|nr:glycine-rich protein-like [Photinus pyralis]